MTTITKERIELFIKNPLDNGLTRGEQMELARIALASLGAEPVSQTYKLPPLSSSEVNDAAWKLHNMLTEHVPLNGRQFNNLKGCFYEALKVAMRNYPVTPDGW
ncbi:TPA: molecular chaperone DnaJ, partial [Salmonella enterica subsp. enterica serovar Derby]